MKLRLETGNFKIVGVSDMQAQTVTINSLPKGLSPEDFLGCVVDMGTMGFAVVTHAYNSEENVVAFDVVGNLTMNYNRLTGEVTTAE